MRALNILVADDEEGIRDLLRDALAAHGHHVTCADNGVAAVNHVATGEIEVVFLDVKMPNGDGLTALREIREIRPSLPVVMITGCPQWDQTSQAFKLDARACLVKPFSVRDVLSMLEIVLDDDEAATADQEASGHPS